MERSPICIRFNKRIRGTLLYGVLLLLIVLLLFLNVSIGSVSVPFGEVLRCLARRSGDSMFYNIIWQIRFPRALAAILLGGALALSGYLLQTFFHNPIAGPFVLGISSGAKLAVALVMVFLLGQSVRISSFSLILAAFVGAMLSMGFVLLMSNRLRHSAMLVVSGIMIGYVCSAITDLVVTFADDSDIVNLHNWSLGSFSGISWSNVGVMALVVFATSFLTFLTSKPMAAYQMGEAYARSMGVNVRLFRVALVVLSSVLSACVTAFAGPVSFVGIAVPQLTRRLFHTVRPLVLIPANFLGGAVWCLFCDLLARTLFAPTELSISTVTAIFGVPVVIYVMMNHKKESQI